MSQAQQNLYKYCWLTSVGGVLGLFSASVVDAQIVPDATLGEENSRIVQNATVRGEVTDLIEGGAFRGSNLFHSFTEFNIGQGQRVYFANPLGIANILTRVTGNDVSDIMGTLGVDGGANLFLLNPNGIIFGPNAQLDVSGSFVGSTADGFTFSDGGEFSAASPGDSSLLSVAVPLGVQWGPARDAGAITNTGTLSVGQDFTLSGGSVTSTGQLLAPSGRLIVEGVAGDVQVSGAQAQTLTLSASDNLSLRDSQLYAWGDLDLLAGEAVQIRDSETNPFVAYAGEDLTVQGTQTVDIFALNYPSSGLFSGGDMVLRSANPVGGDAHYWAGGNFQIQQLNGELGDLFSPYDPVIRSQGDVEFESYEGASLHIFAGGSVIINGTVRITGTDFENGFQEDVLLSNPIEIPSDFPEANRKTSVLIDSTNRRTLDVRAGTTAFGTPQLVPEVDFPGIGNLIVPFDFSPSDLATSATINIGGIDAEQVLLTNQYLPNQLPGSITVQDKLLVENPNDDPNNSIDDFETTSIRAFGELTIDSRDDIEILGRINADNRDIPGADVLFLSGGDIQTQNITSGSQGGDAGSIIFNAAGNIITHGSITADVSDFGGNSNTGNASFIQFISDGSITAKDIIGSTNVNTLGGNGGDILLIAHDEIITGNGSSGITNFAFGGVEVFFGVGSFASSGNSGSITLISREGEIDTRQGAIISRAFSDFFENTQAGSVSIQSPHDIRVGDISAVSVNSDTGNFNEVRIDSSRGSVILDDVNINASSLGTAFAGDVVINAGNEISLVNDSEISSEGNSGRIFVQSGLLFLQDSEISVDSNLRGGSIEITANEIELNNSGITAIASTDDDINESSVSNVEIRLLGTLLQLYDNSLISAGAEDSRNGGNLAIDVREGFVLADPFGDSDVLANAFEGRGGLIEIRTNAIFGLEERNPITVFSDINAGSQFSFDGEIVLATLGIDPSRGLLELPTDLVDVGGLVATGCLGDNRAGVEEQGEYSVTGRGGVAQSPTETLSPDGGVANLATLDDDDNLSAPAEAVSAVETVEILVEAQGLAVNGDGAVVIVSGESDSPSNRTVLPAGDCN